METDATRASLLSRVRDPADHAAWREFESRYGDLILRYARACGLQLADAEDARQAVLLNLSSALRSFHYSPDRGRFRHYVARAARNAVHLVRARHGRSPAPLEPDDDIAGGHTEHGRVWEREWMAHHYRRALRVVRETFDERSVAMFERLLSGASADVVADEFAATPAAVRQLKHRIRERLREVIAAQLREEENDGG